MNWYQLYKESRRNPLDKIARDIAALILSFISKRETNKMLKGDIINYYDSPLKIDFINFNATYIESIYHDRKFDVEAAFYVNKVFTTIFKAIHVGVFINTATFSKNDYNDLYVELIGAIRHELEHAMVFYKDPNIRPQYNIEEMNSKSKEYWLNKNMLEYATFKFKNYLLDKSEIEAFVRGWMLQAKKKHLPLYTMLENNIYDFLVGRDNIPVVKNLINKREDTGLDIKQMADTIKMRYVERLHQLYPDF